jgi:hypothetical protein
MFFLKLQNQSSLMTCLLDYPITILHINKKDIKNKVLRLIKF